MAIFTGKTVAEAIENGLITLKLTKSEANIKVLNGPKQGMFGRVRKEAEVEVLPINSRYHAIGADLTSEDEVEAPIESLPEAAEMTNEQVRSMLVSSLSRATAEYVKGLAAKKDIILSYEIKISHDEWLINLKTNNETKLIGTNGATINEFQDLANQYVREARLDDIEVVLDTNDYRAKRSKILKKVAKQAVNEVIKSEEVVVFDPMPEGERAQIHEFLKDNQQVRSYSEGKGKQRVVVVAPRTKLND